MKAMLSYQSNFSWSSTPLPIINISALIAGTDTCHVAEQIGCACRDYGFFYITGHGVDEALQTRLEELSRAFFALPLESKMKVRMELGGLAWRGYFPVGGELTSGMPDQKEGLYFGAELGNDHSAVKAGLPLHGTNLFPEEIPELRMVLLDYMQALTQLGHKLMEGISLSLGLEESYFADHYTTDPLVLFRIFHYPASHLSEAWGVGEHTDYGLLTILKQDNVGGLEVKTKGGWIAAPPFAGTFICNIGDMLERMTAGLYRSTPHRVRNKTPRNRLSFPFFFDPNFHAEVHSLAGVLASINKPDDYERWDGASVHDFNGTYGEYLLRKVSKVFPELSGKVSIL